MKHTAHVTAVLGTLLAASSLVAPATAAPATTVLAPSHVTVTSTDYTPSSGETFHLYGAIWSQGDRVPATISVKTFRDGEWVQLKGAVMHTNRYDKYNLRIILQQKGERQLRVIGDPDSDTIKIATRTITVTVQ